MSDQEEDFAAMFEASVKARQFQQGQTIEGTIVAFGPEVAFVSVGGKCEAQIDDPLRLSAHERGWLNRCELCEEDGPGPTTCGLPNKS